MPNLQRQNTLLMKKLLIGLLLLGSVTNLLSQSTREVKGYYDIYSTKIKSIEQVTDDNKLHGVQKYYYENGDLRDLLNFKFDKKEGLQKVFFHNGKIKYANNYKNGQFHGESKEYAFDNEKYYLFKKGIFENGKAIESTKYYSNGNKWEYTVINGLCNMWYENGEKAMEYTFVNGLNHGETNTWNMEGKLIIKGNYKDNQEDGIWEYYGANGEVIRTEYMSMGKNSGQWKIFYDKDFKPVTKKSDAEYYRIIDYNSNSYPDKSSTIPQEVFQYSNTHFVYKATDYHITGEKQWEGYIEDDNGESLEFEKKVFIEVGEAKYYHKNGQLSSTGIKGHNGGKYSEAGSVPIMTWYFYGTTGELKSANIYEWGKMRGRYYYSKLKQTKTGDQVQKDKEAIENNKKNVEKQQVSLEEYEVLKKTVLQKSRKIESLYLVEDPWGSVTIKGKLYRVKKKDLYNAYHIYYDVMQKMIDEDIMEDDLATKNIMYQDLIKLFDRMIELFNNNTNEIEKQLKNQTDPDQIGKILGL